MGRPQRTISQAVELSGSGLFSGRPVNLRLLPADTDTGFLFVRTDLPDAPVVPATTEAVGDGFRCTTLSWNNVTVKAVEHLLAACAGLQVDNLIIELDADEMPALDGCAMSFADALQEGGIVDQGAERRLLKLEEHLSVAEGSATIVGMPCDEGLTISYVLDLGQDYGPPEALTVSVDSSTFMEELAHARTFGLDEDYEEFRRMSLGAGITDENSFILCKDGSVKTPRSLAPAQLRFPDEPVRHKVVDLLGDLALANTDLQARIVAVHSGHKLNAQFANQLRRLIEEVERPKEYLDVREIRRILSHRYPFLLVDRVLRVEGERRIVALKSVTVNEPFFQGHFPDYPIMPGVLQLEALAQTAGLLLLRKLEHTGKLALLVAVDGVKWRRPVVPGDQLVLEVEAVRIRSRTVAVKGKATVNDEVACEAEMRFMLVDADAM